MKCCNVKTLSYISAWLQLVILIILAVATTIVTILNGDEYVKSLGIMILIFCYVVLAVAISIFVTLLVGIKRNRLILVSIFMYAAHTTLVLAIIYIIYGFVMGFVHKEELSTIFTHLLKEVAFTVVEVLLTTPIHMLHKRMHHASPSSDHQSNSKEQYGLSTNQPVHKPSCEL